MCPLMGKDGQLGPPLVDGEEISQEVPRHRSAAPGPGPQLRCNPWNLV
jgi:hypothetical protein